VFRCSLTDLTYLTSGSTAGQLVFSTWTRRGLSSEILALAHHANALLLADELELAQSRANVIVPNYFHGPISCTVKY
jgi:hypothetical protein